MLQVLQHQRTGQLSVEEVPMPQCHSDGILVRTQCSLISAGTEKASVESTRLPLYQRARKQPEQVKLLFDFLKKEGIASTINKVKSKLDSYKSLGYSASGIVVESNVDEFSPGVRVACGGAGIAVHSEILSVPKNLAVQIPAGVSYEEAAYTTVGTIALHGLRQADVKIGETVAVIGLGLLGLITVQLLKASGCRVIGADINPDLFELAQKCGCDYTFHSSRSSKNEFISYSRGLGCDAVIITASTQSNEPLELALDICRKKGRIVIVGAVQMNVPRSPFYEKEIDIRISCSYGPGRYDVEYEQRGIDYPPAYVRWTENRNMQAFLDLIEQKKIDLSILTSHHFDIWDAQSAYDIIAGKSTERYMGIVLNYPDRQNNIISKVYNIQAVSPNAKIKIGFIGAGSFAQSSLLPNLKLPDVDLIAVTTETGVNALTVCKQWNAKYSSTDSSEVISDTEINTIFCSTRHDTHHKYVLEAINNNKPIFVEKPLCVNRMQLEEIENALPKNRTGVMVGFNRRFSKAFTLMKDFFDNRKEPLVMIYRISTGLLSKDHWVFTEDNGGRIIGEVCHFIDCMTYLSGELPAKVSAYAISSDNRNIVNQDNISLNIRFEDGSIGSIIYTSVGSKSLPKEYFEAFGGNKSAIMNNFEKVELYDSMKIKKIDVGGSKGHKEEVAAFIDSIKKGSDLPISFDEIRAVTLCTFAAVQSIASGMSLEIKKEFIR